jgi:hypothetical protein
MSRMINPDKLVSHRCKIGTIPMQKIVDGRCTIAVGKVIRVRDDMHASKWERVRVTREAKRIVEKKLIERLVTKAR